MIAGPRERRSRPRRPVELHAQFAEHLEGGDAFHAERVAEIGEGDPAADIGVEGLQRDHHVAPGFCGGAQPRVG